MRKKLLFGVLSAVIGSITLIPDGRIIRTPLFKVLHYPFVIGEKILIAFDFFRYPVPDYGIISPPVSNPTFTLIGTVIAIAIGLIIYFLIGMIVSTIVKKVMNKK